ncbi:MAG: BtrH N-terminal domain-containing protein [Chloroflexota bacterium]|nr:BtrH N-terminal domain-containing protein [Chloroflexota bacterium]
MGVITNYTQFGGKHSETATITNALAALGVKAPHTGKPFTEAMILGIGGGLGAGYILWEFKEHNQIIIILAFRNRWQYTQKYMDNVFARLGVRGVYKEAGGRKQAVANLRETLDAGIPAVTWADRGHQPYYLLPQSMSGHVIQIVNVVGMDEQTAWIDDLGRQPFTMPVDLLAESRARIGSSKNRVLALHVDPSTSIDLEVAIKVGIQDCVEHLSEGSDSFSLPTFRKLGKMMVDGKNAKGWLKVFEDGGGLYGALKSMYEAICLPGNGGDGLRGMYADFLTESAGIIGNIALNDAASAYRALSQRWIDLGEALLPDAIASFQRTKTLLRTNADRLTREGDAALVANREAIAELDAIGKEHKASFPLPKADKAALLKSLSDQLLALYEEEISALDTLKRAVGAR